jgi:hypothetical protein
MATDRRPGSGGQGALDRAQQVFQVHTSGRTVLVLLCVFAALVVVLNFTDLPFGSRALAARAGGLAILDLRSTGYTPDEAYSLLEALGSAGRSLYLCLLLAADVLLPLIGALFFCTCIALLLRHLIACHHPAQRLILLPVVTMLADLGENTCIVILLLTFPRRLDGLARIASLLTLLKGGVGMLVAAVIVVCLLALVYRWMVRRHGNAPK